MAGRNSGEIRGQYNIWRAEQQRKKELPFVKDLEATLDRIGLRAQELIQLFLSGVPKQIDKPTADALIYAAKTGMDNESRSVLKPDDPKVYTVSSLWLNDKLFNDLANVK